MIGRRRFDAASGFSFAVWLVLWIGGSGGNAQAANLPPNIRQAISLGPVLPQIEAYVKEKLALVAGDDLVAQSKAREDLISEVLSGPGAPEPTPQFRDAYATVLNGQLMELTKNDDPRVRLNAAVIAARIAEYAGNAALQPVTLALLGDSSEGTRLWALKSAKAVLPHAVTPGANGGGAAPIIGAIVKIGQDTRSGAVVQSVYEALTIEKGKVGGAAWASVLSATIPALHDVLRARVDQYADGVPEEPLSEGSATLYMTSKDIWPAQVANQQFDSIQIMSDLMGVTAQRTVGAANEQKQDLILLIRRISKAIDVAGTWPPSNAALSGAAKLAENIPLPSAPEEVIATVNQTVKALKAVKGFENLRPPPDVEASSTAATTNTK